MSTRSRLNRREFLRLGAYAGAGALLAACAPTTPAPAEEPAEEMEDAPEEAPSAEAEDITMTVWSNDRTYIENFTLRSEDLQADHPEYNIEFTIEENPDLWDNFLTLFVGGLEGVDIIAMEQGPIQQLWKGNVAEENLIPMDEFMTPDEMENFARWEMFSWNGKKWGISAEMDGVVYYYQPALFEAAGVEIDSVETYFDFVQAGLTMREQDKYMVNIAPDGWLHVLPTQNGGGYFSVDGEVILDSPETIEATQLMYDMLVTDEVANPSGNLWDPAGLAVFENGDVVGQWSADWWGDFYLKDLLPDMEGQWRIRPLPAFEAGARRTATWGGTCHGIAKATEHPDLAFEFLEKTYIDYESVVDIFLRTRFFPVRKDTWNDPRILEFSDPYYGDQAIGAVYAELASEVPFDPTHAYKPEAVTKMNDIWVLIYEGEVSVEDGLKEVADEVRELMAA